MGEYGKSFLLYQLEGAYASQSDVTHCGHFACRKKFSAWLFTCDWHKNLAVYRQSQLFINDIHMDQ